jgi:acyl-CoA thioester hydrolase
VKKQIGVASGFDQLHKNTEFQPMQGQEHKRFAVEDRVRWSDVDKAGIIYFGSYVRFFEIAETELFREIGLPYSHAFELIDSYPVRAQFHCDFRSPAYLDDMLTVEIWVGSIGSASLTLEFEIKRTQSEKGLLGETLMTGHCVLVTVNRDNYRPVRVHQRLRDALEDYIKQIA